MIKRDTFGEIIRFGMVGTTAAAIHYGTYWLLQRFIDVNVAYTVGYIVSFIVNYILSARFTFREKNIYPQWSGFHRRPRHQLSHAHSTVQFLPLGWSQSRHSTIGSISHRRTSQLPDGTFCI